jgi:hypothetical protein
MRDATRRTTQEDQIGQEAYMAERVKRVEYRNELVHGETQRHERKQDQQPEQPPPVPTHGEAETYDAQHEQGDGRVGQKPSQIGQGETHPLFLQEQAPREPRRAEAEAQDEPPTHASLPIPRICFDDRNL